MAKYLGKECTTKKFSNTKDADQTNITGDIPHLNDKK